jgi:hypothetical protein
MHIIFNRLTLDISEYTSDEDRARLYSTCRLALCASSAGGASSVMDAAAFGLMVVATDAPPQDGLLTQPDTVALVPPSDRPTPLGYAHQHVIQSDDIVKAAKRLPIQTYNDELIQRCASNHDAHRQAFKAGFTNLLTRIRTIVEAPSSSSSLSSSSSGQERDRSPIRRRRRDANVSPLADRSLTHCASVLVTNWVCLGLIEYG